jgi:hypothetical protein
VSDPLTDEEVTAKGFVPGPRGWMPSRGSDQGQPTALQQPRPLTPAELLATEPRPPRFAIPQIAPRGEVTTLFASVGAGKTTLYQSALVANTRREPWLGDLGFEGPQRFVVFDWENNREQIANALGRLGLSNGEGGDFIYFLEPDVNLDTEPGREQVREILTEHKATCAIFDSRDDAFPNTNENDGRDILAAMRPIKDLAGSLDVAMVLVAHEPKADYGGSWDRLAGHTMWGRKSDQMFRYRRHGDVRILEHAKHRGLDKRASLKITLVTEGEPDVGPMRLEAERYASEEARAEALAEDVTKLEELLEQAGDRERKGIREMFGWSEDRFSKVVKASTRVYQPGGARKPYSVKPRDEEETLV